MTSDLRMKTEQCGLLFLFGKDILVKTTNFHFHLSNQPFFLWRSFAVRMIHGSLVKIQIVRKKCSLLKCLVRLDLVTYDLP